MSNATAIGTRRRSHFFIRPPASRLTALALAAAVGLVLADSSVVVLALPEIYRELDVSVGAVVWVLIGFNLVLACAAIALLPRRESAR